MGVDLSFFFSSRMPVMAVVLVWLICFGAINRVKGTPLSVSTQIFDQLLHSSFQESRTPKLVLEDTVLLSARDLAPDVLAAAVPVPSPSQKTKPEHHPENQNLHLRSSSHNVSGIAGFRLFSLPIQVSQLASLLSDARNDLQIRDANDKTKFYEFNSTKWSFSVLNANAPLNYGYILGIVSHFIKLSSTPSPPTDLTSTLVAVVLNGSTPIADVTIMPLLNATNNSYVPFSTFGVHRNDTSSTEPVEIATLTPTGSTCSYALLNETAALAPYAYPSSATAAQQSALEPRSLEAEIIRPVIQTMFSISVRLWRRPDGFPVRVESAAIASVALVALQRLYIDRIKWFFMKDFMADPATHALIDEMWSVDTGWFEMGRLMGRLVMEVKGRHGTQVAMALTARIWIRIIRVLFAPATMGLSVLGIGWGMEGKILGPGEGDGSNATQVEVGRWELSFWDNY